MNSSNFVGELFIGIGAQTCYYTLRESYLHYSEATGEPEVRSYYWQNLSQNLDEAIRKATEFSEKSGTPFKCNRSYLEQEMTEIKRATAEQMAERVRKEQEQQAEWEATYQERLAEQRRIITEGKYPFGQFRNKEFLEASVSYMNWLMTNEFEEGSIINDVKLALLEKHSDVLLPVPNISLLVGEEKMRMTFDVTVIKRSHFDTASYSGWGMERIYVITMVTSEGACLVSFSGAFCEEVGEKLKIKATVKKHDEYNGQAQTIVQRIKVLS